MMIQKTTGLLPMPKKWLEDIVMLCLLLRLAQEVNAEAIMGLLPVKFS